MIPKPTSRTIARSLYHLIAILLIAVNLRLDRWLMGWDGLYPELNPVLNIIRGLSAGWQEYYGAGLVGGHGFAATLPHTLIISLFSLLLPQHLLRQLFIFLCYYLGGLGMFFVTEVILDRMKRHRDRTHEAELRHSHYSPWIALLGSLFYLLNFGTIQVFYVPLEAFTVHFAALPWLTYGALLLLELPSKKRIFFFLIVSLISSIQGFIPAIFVAYATTLVILSRSYMLEKRTRSAAQSIGILWLIVITANAYWLGSVAYFAKTASNEYTSAYNNIISTPGFLAKSIAFGTFSRTILLESPLVTSVELGGPLLGSWISHINQPWVMAIGFFFFALAILGALRSLTAKHWGLSLGFVLSAVYLFGNLAIDLAPFSTLLHTVQQWSPDIMQAFRTTFTKFGTGYVFYITLFITLGIEVLFEEVSRFQKHLWKGIFAGVFLLIILSSLPVWNHGLVYSKLFTRLPSQYQELIRFTNNQPEGKIADFPQDCAEGWYNELWGYFGSGFLWYGMNKPMMARAFDVWSSANENYYWEVSSLLKSEQFDDLDAVFQKYQVRYILYDANLTHCRSQKGFTSSREFSNYLSSSAHYKKLKEVSGQGVLPITLYERVASQSVVSLGTRLPNIQLPQQYTDLDLAYRTYGPYITDTKSPTDAAVSRVPFSKRGDPLPSSLLLSLKPVAVATLSALADTSSCEAEFASQGIARVEEVDGAARMLSTNTDLCRTATVPDINTSHPYIVEITGRHILGNQPTLSITNKGRNAGLDIPLRLPEATGTVAYYLPPSFPSEVNLTITIRNQSQNRYTSINDVSYIRLLSVGASPSTPPQSDIKDYRMTSLDTVIHPFSTLYITHISDQKNGSVLVIDEAYDPGWMAFDTSGLNLIPQLFPFLFGKLIDRHVLVNHWQNGWIIPRNGESTFIIIFVPEFLEIGGFLLLGAFLYRLLRKKRPIHS